MRRLILILPLVLAACHQSATVSATNASSEEVANQVAAAQANGGFLSPGHWDGNITISKIAMPGLPPQLAERMKSELMKSHPITHCLTPEEAKRPGGQFFGGGKACTYDHFKMGGGVIDAKMTCTDSGRTQTTTLNGSYTADNYTMHVDSKVSPPPGTPMGPMTMTMTVDSKRAGECTGKETS